MPSRSPRPRSGEVTRSLAWRASGWRVQVGQDEAATWTVLADPEGGEFCVLGSQDT